jgi:hypothetical protein
MVSLQVVFKIGVGFSNDLTKGVKPEKKIRD